MRKALIIASAPENDINYVKEIMLKLENPLIVCADGGIYLARQLGLKADIWVGDYDSSDKLKEEAGICVTLPVEKDENDLKEAIDLALLHHADDLTIVNATGGRLDHFLANVMLLEYLSHQGAKGRIVNANNVIMFFPCGKVHFQNDRRFRFISIVALDEKLEGVTLKGLKYPLKDATVEIETLLPISNEAVEDEFSIEIKKGRALLIFSNDERVPV